MNSDPNPAVEESSDDSVYSCFVSGAKFGMIIATLTLLVSHLSN